MIRQKKSPICKIQTLLLLESDSFYVPHARRLPSTQDYVPSSRSRKSLSTVPSFLQVQLSTDKTTQFPNFRINFTRQKQSDPKTERKYRILVVQRRRKRLTPGPEIDCQFSPFCSEARNWIFALPHGQTRDALNCGLRAAVSYRLAHKWNRESRTLRIFSTPRQPYSIF